MKASFLLLSLATTLVLSACQTPSQAATVSSNNSVCVGDECELTPEQTALMEETNEKSEWTAEEIAEMEGADALYMDYTKAAYDSMLGQEPFAIFFHASWCPTCQFMEQDILSNSGEFPEGSVILKADYDTETALKEEYSIYSQSIVVMINADGSVAETLVAPSASTLTSAFTSLLQ